MGNFKLDVDGLSDLMKSVEMQAHLSDCGQAVASAAGQEIYDHETYVLNYVAVENIFPGSPEAARENFKHNTLLKALGSVGLSMK